MNIERVAQRFAFERTGYRLVDFKEIALPVYRLSVVASFMERKPIPAIHEFIMRAIGAGIVDEKELSGFLGLSERQVVSSLAELDSTELIKVDTDLGHRCLSLTNRGEKAIAKMSTVQPRLAEIVLFFDGLTRKLLSPRHEPFWQYRQVQAAGIKEISPKPPKRPVLQEISIDEARRVSRELTDFRGKAQRDLLAVRAIERANRQFQIGYVLLYKANHGDEEDFLVVLDDVASDAHKEVIIRSGGLGRFGIEFERGLPEPRIFLEDKLNVNQLKELERTTEEYNIALQDAFATAAEETLASDGGSDAAEEDRNNAILEAVSAVIDSLRTTHIRHIDVFEHPRYLDEALRKSEDRLLVISPWLRRQVLDQRKIRQIRERLESGCKVYIGWGIGDENRRRDDRPADEDVLRQLSALEKEFANFYFVDLGNTHEKILLKDSEYVITTSFNWLSFRGDPDRTMRYERGVYIGIKELVEDEFQRLVSRFEASKAVTPSDRQLEALRRRFEK